MKTTRIALVGCGNIAGQYAAVFAAHPQMEVCGATDIDPSRAHKLVDQFGGRVYPDLDAILNDAQVDVVVNLTLPELHFDIVSRCIEAGKPTHTEKPLTLTSADAQRLVELARKKDVPVSCSPVGFLGEAQQTAIKHVRDGALGAVRLVYAEVNQGRIESWHPAPIPFFQVGPIFDVGVYPLSVIEAALGPVKRVTAFGTKLMPERRTKDGEAFTIGAPDYFLATLELNSGPIVRLCATFYATNKSRHGKGIEFHGDAGNLHLDSWVSPSADVWLADSYGAEYRKIDLVAPPYTDTWCNWALGIEELNRAITGQGAVRSGIEMAAHTVEVLEAIHRSAATQQAVDVTSRFPLPSLRF